MHKVYQAGQKIKCEECGEMSAEPVEDYSLKSMGDRAKDHCDSCGEPFYVTNNDDERQAFLVDFESDDEEEDD